MYYAFPPGEDSINNPSPAFLATLPTDPAALLNYLRAHVHGSSSTDEAVFVAVGDMLSGGFAPPALRAATLRVLERTPHVTVRSGQDSLGRTATVVDFVDESGRPGVVQSLYFDPATARLLQTGRTASDLAYSGTVVSSDVVNSIPAQVLRDASASGTCMAAARIQDDQVCVKALTAGAVSTEATGMPSAIPSKGVATSTGGSVQPAN